MQIYFSKDSKHEDEELIVNIFTVGITKNENNWGWELIASLPICNEDSEYSYLDSDYWTREIVSRVMRLQKN